MKKVIKLISIVCLLAMLVGILPVVGVSASDAATLVVTPSSESVKAGKDFSVTVSIANNPGIILMVYSVEYDANVFEYVSAETSAEVFSGHTLEEQEGKFADFLDAGAADATNDGELVTLHFTAKEDAELTAYTFTAKADYNNTVNFAGSYVAVAGATADVTVIDKNTNLTKIDAAQVNLGTDISVTYRVTLDPDHAGAQMKFTIHGDEYLVDGYSVGGNVCEYTLINIAPQCMGDNIKAEVMFGGAAVATKETYSILENCKNLRATYPGDATLQTLTADLLVYGAAAQKYQNYKTNALVSEGITDATALGIPATVDANKKLTTTNEIDGLGFVSCNVRFDYVNSICFKFTAPETEYPEDYILVITEVNGRTTTTLETYEYADYKDNYVVENGQKVYYVYVEQSVLDFGNTKLHANLKFYDPDQDMYLFSKKLCYNVNNYCYRMQQNSANPAMVELAQALYNYGQSAVAFQNAH